VPGGFCDGSVTGGIVYRGAIPELQGRYVFADFCQGFIHSLVWNGAGGVTGPVLDLGASISPAENGGSIDLVTGISEDGYGEMLLVDFVDGEVFRVPEPGASALGIAVFAPLAALGRIGSRGGRHPDASPSTASSSAP
jgi:hypothetical protein